MHIYVAARGILDSLNRWENDLSATYYPYKLSEENAKIFGSEIGMLQVSVRPIRLYEIVVPENQVPSLLRKMQPSTAWNSRYDKYIAFLRKALGLKKVDITKIPKRLNSDAMISAGVHCTVIGTKADKWVDGQEQI